MAGPGREFSVAWQTDASELPLWGRRIMVTGPRQYAGKLAGLLLAAGARPVWLPTIAIRRLTEPAHLQVGCLHGTFASAVWRLLGPLLLA